MEGMTRFDQGSSVQELICTRNLSLYAFLRNPGGNAKESKVGHARVPKGKSDGAFKLNLSAVGRTNKLEAQCFKEPLADGKPHCEHWLVDEGAGKDGQYMAGCNLRDVTFQCRAQIVKSHENSNSHQKRSTASMRKQKDKADPRWHALAKQQSTQPFSAQARS
eukprot:1143960-Pelagomonas_calceolata.AAC.2